MNARYSAERLLTLTEAKKISGYTSDHLAYLCRSDFLWAERQGRMWLTCELALVDYKKVLFITKHPIPYAQQEPYLSLEKFKTQVKTESNKNPKTDRFLELAKEEFRVTAEKLQNASLSSFLDLDLNSLIQEQLNSLARFFRGIDFGLNRVYKTPSQVFYNTPKYEWLPVALAPENLPVGIVPDYLERTFDWRASAAILTACFALVVAMQYMTFFPDLFNKSAGYLIERAVALNQKNSLEVFAEKLYFDINSSNETPTNVVFSDAESLDKTALKNVITQNSGDDLVKFSIGLYNSQSRFETFTIALPAADERVTSDFVVGQDQAVAGISTIDKKAQDKVFIIGQPGVIEQRIFINNAFDETTALRRIIRNAFINSAMRFDRSFDR